MNELRTVILSDGIRVTRKKYTLNINPRRKYRIEFPCNGYNVVDNMLYCEVMNCIKRYRLEGKLI